MHGNNEKVPMIHGTFGILERFSVENIHSFQLDKKTIRHEDGFFTPLRSFQNDRRGSAALLCHSECREVSIFVLFCFFHAF
jgi:hypothetical protein